MLEMQKDRNHRKGLGTSKTEWKRESTCGLQSPERLSSVARVITGGSPKPAEGSTDP